MNISALLPSFIQIPSLPNNSLSLISFFFPQAAAPLMRYLEQELQYMNENLVKENFNRYKACDWLNCVSPLSFNLMTRHDNVNVVTHINIRSVVLSTSLLSSGAQPLDSLVEQLGEDPPPGGNSASTARGAHGVLSKTAVHTPGWF